ncbi:Zn-ribbon domain-containing OB-fold protein [Trujillonella endophytica]|uniref:DUF35 domain-containing protein n=1 Tax=Trujillonella endophytica TaxID=673521 RepID=A0A1H8Q483_9ACTN|nr:zinc ribbon domain-containing protein [Trujillella endophytica]SEO48771.1 hypothetical protein SAMN05660991_00549 [Trujillella endophytica]
MSAGAPPVVTEIARPWWDALARGEVAVQSCSSCAGWVFYPRPFCPSCGGRDLAWRTVDPAATLYTWTVAEAPVSPHFAHLHRPVLAVAELGIGVRVPTTLVHADPDDVRIGMALTPVFDAGTYPGFTLLRYRPA